MTLFTGLLADDPATHNEMFFNDTRKRGVAAKEKPLDKYLRRVM